MNNSTEKPATLKRPGGITVLCILLAWLGLVGLSNAWFIFAGEFPGKGPLVGVGVLVYGVTALVACVGLWRMASWAPKALHAWMLAFVFYLVGHALGFDDFIRGNIPGALGLAVFVGLLFLGIHRYVSIQFNPGDN